MVSKKGSIILYSIAAIGAPVTFHYCMGRLVNYSLINSESGICSNCGMEKDPAHEKDCCKDISVLVKTNQSHLTVSLDVEDNGQCTRIPETFYNRHKFAIGMQLCMPLHKTADPPMHSPSLFIRHRDFRI